MDRDFNPYRSSNVDFSDGLSFWKKLKNWIAGEPGIRDRFSNGEPVLQYGVLFFVEPDDKFSIHAAIPLSSIKPALIELGVKEAKRELWKFLQTYEELGNEIQGRKLIVRFIENYQDVNSQICERIVTDWFYDVTTNHVR